MRTTEIGDTKLGIPGHIWAVLNVLEDASLGRKEFYARTEAFYNLPGYSGGFCIEFRRNERDDSALYFTITQESTCDHIIVVIWEAEVVHGRLWTMENRPEDARYETFRSWDILPVCEFIQAIADTYYSKKGWNQVPAVGAFSKAGRTEN